MTTCCYCPCPVRGEATQLLLLSLRCGCVAQPASVRADGRLTHTNMICRYKASLKALQTITNKSKQRKAKQQEAQEKVARQQEDLQAALETLGAEDNDLEEQQLKLEAMQAKVQEELGKGDEEAGGPEPEIFMETLPPVQVCFGFLGRGNAAPVIYGRGAAAHSQASAQQLVGLQVHSDATAAQHTYGGTVHL